MKIGTMFCGKVQAIDEQSIQTKFFVLGLPLVPIATYYVLEETANGVRGFEIPNHDQSILATYLRWWSFMLAVFAGVYASLGRDMEGMWLLVALGGGVWAWSSFGYGNTSNEDWCRRVTLAVATGIHAPPEILPVTMRSKIRDELKTKMKEASLGLNAEDHAELPDRSAFFTLYAYASYSSPDGSGEWGKVRARVWTAIVGDEKYAEVFAKRLPRA